LQEQKEKSGHSEEWLSIYSRGAETTATWEVAEEEKEAVALRLAAKGAEEQAENIYYSMGDGAGDAGGLAEQSRASKRTDRM
jgi:hypothetical protein